MYDADEGVLEFPGGGTTPLRLVAAEIHLDSIGLLHALVSIHNAGRDSIPGPAGVAVLGFVPPAVRPVNAVCPPQPDPEPTPELCCVFDHRETYGVDGLLAPGETSEPVEWIFENTGGESFAFRARLAPDGSPLEGEISGVVFEDLDRDGRRDLDEPGVPGVSVGLEKPGVVLIRRTDDRGRFAFGVNEPGIYRVRKQVLEGWRPTTPSQLQVFIVRRPDGSLSGFGRADFGCVRDAGPGELFVEGVVFLDHDRNGTRDASEPGIPSVGIAASGLECLGPGAGVARSDSAGRYRIRGSEVRCELPWLVRRLPEPGLVGTTPSQAILRPPAPAGGTFHLDFGLAPPDSSQVSLTVEGAVYLDRNANGQRDLGEHGLRGIQVQLLSPCDVLRATYTDHLGTYRFGPAETRICPVTGVWQSQPDLQNTTPNPVFIEPPVVPGNHLRRVDFGVGPGTTPG
ncbi:MAG: SdrD B-like domain-containing protein [Candidatus Krumholzibacteriia bacterium]